MSCEVLNSQLRSRSTVRRSSESDTDIPPRCAGLPGASSVRRSRSEGLIRSRFDSAMGRRLPVQLDYTGLQERGLAHVGCEHALAHADVGIGPEVAPFRLSTQPYLVVLRGLGSRISRRQERDLLAAVGERQPRGRPDEIAQIARLLDLDARQALERNPVVLAVE